VKSVCVIGLGYIGLPTAALLASSGYKVSGFDCDPNIVATINLGEAHIVEPELDKSVNSAVIKGNLRAATRPNLADIFIICVPTPFNKTGEIPTANIDYVMAATKEIASFVKAGNLIIIESTCPVGTTQKVSEELCNFGVDVTAINIAYCPERVLPGKIMTELVQNDRIVGGLTEVATVVVANFYRTFVKGRVLETNAKTAEMCKLTENSFRDVNIAFANELSLICSKNGIDVRELIRLANCHPRVNILQPGPGVGGHCIAVDPWFIVSQDPDNARLIRVAREVNDYKTKWAVSEVKKGAIDFLDKTGKKPKILCLGLAFKPDIDDLRESPALSIAESLQDLGFDIVCVEPNIRSHHSLLISNFDNCLSSSDIVVCLVKHKEFLAIEKGHLSGKIIYDLCGLL
jgi:UDP-N-acetyl-D-mannosaminuronic acid dehydrogenase